VYNRAHYGELKVETCLPNTYTSFIPLVPDSASNTQIVLANVIAHINGTNGSGQLPVALKIFADPPNPDADNSLLMEVEIYSKYVKALLERKHTPNLIAFVAYARCSNISGSLLQLVRNDRKNIFIHGLRKISQGAPNPGTLNILVCEQAIDSLKIDEWTSTKPSQDFLFSVIFQLFYTLVCFNRIGNTICFPLTKQVLDTMISIQETSL
jgi:hypothetical protein